eukprot:4071292-Ditylum_brightwellii.AAC.1
MGAMLRVGCPTKQGNWADLMELPTSKTFDKSSNTRQETTYQEKRNILHCKLHTKVLVNNIKFNLMVLEVLNQMKVFIRQDNLKTTEMASPGFVIYKHPTITRKDCLCNNIAEYLETMDTSDS